MSPFFLEDAVFSELSDVSAEEKARLMAALADALKVGSSVHNGTYCKQQFSHSPRLITGSPSSPF